MAIVIAKFRFSPRVKIICYSEMDGKEGGGIGCSAMCIFQINKLKVRNLFKRRAAGRGIPLLAAP